MKKEIKELLNSENGELEINSLFLLKRWVLNPETDELGRNGECLVIEMKTRYKNTITIESRDVQGIMAEVENCMSKMMDDYKNDLIKRWRSGEISKYL